ncbi:phage tail protein [Halodesulfovibrio aestuarii]|uniref:Phage tail protein n=1 Tax=Halodesulfovibrio aestuarii TaxID=126333 RepID=A0ABV4JQJ7_9BACT
MPQPMMRLGEYVFSLDTAVYQSMSRTSKYNWAEQARIGRNPSLQYTGTGADTLSLPGIIFPTFKGKLRQLEAMRAEAEKGTPLLLIDLYGLNKVNRNVLGYWCITSVKEKTSDYLAGGIPQKIEFTLDLKYFGDKL